MVWATKSITFMFKCHGQDLEMLSKTLAAPPS